MVENNYLRRRMLMILLLLTLSAGAAFAQTTSFTYQGRLTDGGTAANGNYDLQFVLFDSLSGGAQVGSPQTINTVAVSNGVFTVSLDFGASAFPGANRFLEISARPTGVGSFTLLSPRQQTNSTPYAIRSLNASTADAVIVNGVPAGSGNYIQNGESPQASSNFSISGNGTAGGTLSGNVVNATTQVNINGIRILSAPPGTCCSNLFAGNSAGRDNTTGGANSFFGPSAGRKNTGGSSNSSFGTAAGESNMTGNNNASFGSDAGRFNVIGSFNSYFGTGAGTRATGSLNTFVGQSADFSSDSPSGSQNTLLGAQATIGTGPIFSPLNATAIGAKAMVTNSNALVLGSIASVNGATADTDVGIGTTAPTARLSVIATGDGARVLHLGTERGWVFKQLGTGASTALELTGENPNNNNKHFVINTDGNVGIGTTGPLDRLHVGGDIRTSTGCVRNGSGNQIAGTCSSDVRFKRDITPFPSLLSKVTQLRPVHYYWRAAEFPQQHFGNTQGYGLVAQEVEQVLPELVSEDAQGYKLVDYSKVPFLLLQAVKELKAENDTLKQQQELVRQQQEQMRKEQQQLDGLKKLVCRSHRRSAICR